MQIALKSFLPGLFTALVAVATISCAKTTELPPSTPPHRQIAVLQLGTHDVIDQVVEGFRGRLGELYGDQVELTVVNANFDMSSLPTIATQLAGSNPDILVGVTTPASNALVGANLGNKPLVFTFVSDPGAIGYTRTGALLNTTGSSDQVDYGKTLDLIRSLAPPAKKIGYLLTRSEPNALIIHKGFLRMAPSKGFEIVTAVIGGSEDVSMAAETLAGEVDVFLTGGDNTVMSNIDTVLTTANGRRKPVFACDELSVARGALAAYSVDYHLMGRNAANTCAAIFGGADPNHIPLDVYVGTRLVINRHTAEALGVKVPPIAYTVATRVIE